MWVRVNSDMTGCRKSGGCETKNSFISWTYLIIFQQETSKIFYLLRRSDDPLLLLHQSSSVIVRKESIEINRVHLVYCAVQVCWVHQTIDKKSQQRVSGSTNLISLCLETYPPMNREYLTFDGVATVNIWPTWVIRDDCPPHQMFVVNEGKHNLFKGNSFNDRPLFPATKSRFCTFHITYFTIILHDIWRMGSVEIQIYVVLRKRCSMFILRTLPFLKV